MNNDDEKKVSNDVTTETEKLNDYGIKAEARKEDKTDKIENVDKMSKINKHSSRSLLKCSHCPYEVARKDCLKKHIEHKHEGVEQKYECDECGKLFKTKEMKRDHIQLDHHKSLLECEEDGCDAVYLSRTGLRDHKSKIHQGKEFSCTACDFVSYRQGIINRHFKEEHIREVLHCNQCEYTTRILMNLRQHKYNKHKVQRKQRRRIGYLGEELGVEWSGNTYKCELCESTFNNTGLLKIHMDGKHGDIKNCQQCKKTFKWAVDLQLHIKSVHEGLKTKCPHCDYQTNYKSSIRSHMATKHGISNIKCNNCDKSFSRNDRLKVHTAFVHEGKCLDCNQCDYTFQSYNAFKQHKKKHINETEVTFSISKTPINFKKQKKKSNSNFKVENNKIKDEVDIRFSCPFCIEEFETPQEMNTHITNHI